MPGDYPQAIEELAGDLSRLPGIGRRTAERLALALLDWDVAHLAALGDRVARLRERVRCCRVCGNLADREECAVCRNPRRDRSVICVVENARQIPVIEKCGHFDGVYHVLGGKLSPLDDIELENLNIDSLFARVRDYECREVILSTSPDVEGEATATCVAAELQSRFAVRVTRVARGLPMGSDMTYADTETMAMALDSRREL